MARALTLVRSDERGLFVRAGGYVARPGGVRGYDHVYDMGDGGLKTGDRVKAHHMASLPIVKLRLSDGTVLHWYTRGD